MSGEGERIRLTRMARVRWPVLAEVIRLATGISFVRSLRVSELGAGDAFEALVEIGKRLLEVLEGDDELRRKVMALCCGRRARR
mgnify:CR=1 FL=1